MIGNVQSNTGKVVEKEKFKTVKKFVAKGDTIPKHNHEKKEILFIVVLGKIAIKLDDTEQHILTPGEILSFNGQHFIQGTALENTTIFVTLIDE